MPGLCIYQRFMPPDPSGAGKQALTLARTVRDAGWNVTILTDERADAAESSAMNGFGVQRVAPPPADPSYPEILAYWGRLCAGLLRVRRRFDVLQIHTADFHHTGAVPIARLLGKRVLVRSSISGEFTNLTLSKSGRAQRQLLRGAGAFVVLSHKLAQEYAAAGMPASKLNLIANGVDTSVYHPVTLAERDALRRQLGLPVHGRIIIYHGVFIERKSLHWLVEVLEDRLGEMNMTLVLVGGPAREESSTGYAAGLRDQISSSPARDRIIVRDPDPAVHRYLQAADAYVLPSTSEGLSNALLEAMAVGLVPIASRTSGSEDVITHGVSGLLFDPGDVHGFLHNLRATFGAAPTIDTGSISAKAVERIESGYSIQATGMQYVDVYNRLLG